MSQEALIFEPKTEKTHTIPLDGHVVFVMIHDQDNQQAAGTCIPRTIIEHEHLQPIVDKLVSYFKKGSFKLVGPEKLLKQVKSFLEQKGQSVGKTVECEHSTELLFSPHQCRLQILKQNLSKVRVLIVDDSPTICKLLSKIFTEDPQFEIAGIAHSAKDAAPLLTSLKPDVMTLDIHMPEVTGVDFLKSFMHKTPLPTVMITALSLQDGDMVLQALEQGAVDYIQKPSASELSVLAPLIRDKIRMAKSAQVRPKGAASKVVPENQSVLQNRIIDTSQLVAIGSSTGGTEALKTVLLSMPKNIPPIVCVQHIPPVFSKAFADRLNQLCPFEVKEAQDKDSVQEGRVLIAPGGFQMQLTKGPNGKMQISLQPGNTSHAHNPSVDVLFHSVAQLVGPQAIGVILTGMGSDGAKGLLAMKQKGAHTIAQDEKTSVVFGMPRVAIEIGAAENVSPLEKIGEKICFYLKK